MGFLDDLRKNALDVASRAFDEANQWDNGKNWNQRTVPAKGKAAPSATSQVIQGATRPVGQFFNTAATQIPQAYYTGLGTVAQLRGDRAGLKSALEMQRHANSMYGDTGGLFNAGTYYNAQDAQRGNLQTGATKIGGGILQTGATVLPFAKGGSVAVGFGKQPLAQVAKQSIPKLAGEGAAYGATFSAGNQLQTQGKIDPRQLATDTALGTVANVAAPFAIRGAQKGTIAAGRAVAPVVQKGVKATQESLQAPAFSMAEKTANLPRVNVLNDNEAFTLGDYGSYLNKSHLADTTNPQVIEQINQLQMQARNAAQTAGIDITSGSRADIQSRIANYLERRDTFNNTYKQVNEGGYVAGSRALGFDDAKKKGLIFDGVDGKPRFEVDDSIAKFANKNGQKLGDVLDHPQLFRDYPQLRDIKVKFSKLEGKEGSFDPNTNTISVNSDRPTDRQLSTLIHETQHKIQAHEKFATGGNKSTIPKSELIAKKKIIDDELASLKESHDYLNQKVNDAWLANDADTVEQYFNHPTFKRVGELNSESLKLKSMIDNPHKAYNNLAGEAEARAVQSRINMKPEERYVKGQQYYHGSPDADKIKAQGFTVGQRTPDKAAPVFGDGVYMTTIKDAAEPYAKRGAFKSKTGEVLEVNIPENLKLADVSVDDAFKPKLIEKLKKQGYDGIRNDDIVNIFDPKKVNLGKANPRSTFYDSLDVPKEDLIIRNGDGKAMSIEPKADKLSRFANRTVQNSDEVSKPLKKSVKDEQASYTPHTNADRLASSEAWLKGKSDDKAFSESIDKLATGKMDDQDVVNAISIAKKLDASGDEADLIKATEVYTQLSQHLTKKGQEVQAASLLSNRTPEGLQYGAIRDMKKAGIELTPERQNTVKQLVDAIKKLDPKSDEANFARYNLAKYVSSQIPTGTASKIVNFWRAGLLTAPTTTGGNILGNTGETFVRKGFVNPVATAADMAMGAFTGKRTFSGSGGFTEGAVEGAGKLDRFMKTGYDERNALSKYDTKELNYENKALNTYVNGVYRTMSLADQPFWYGARKESLKGLANVEAINQGLKGTGKKNFIEEFMKNPSKQAMEQATQDAKYATFQNETTLGTAAGSLKTGLRNKSDTAGAVADFFIPFTQVPSSIATRVVQRTPVGTGIEVVKQIMNVKNGKGFDQRAMAKAIGEGSFGSAVFAGGYALANSDMLTFGYPEDQKERELWEAEGKQPYSVRLGDRWYSLNYLQPFGTLLAVGGESANSVKEGANPTEAISRGIATAGQAVMNQSFLKGISGVLDAIDDPKRYAENYVSNTAGSVVPNFVRSAARASDPLQRDQKGAVEGLQGSIPGLRQELPAKQDMFGRDMEAKDNFANQYLNPFRPSKVRGQDDVVIEELRRLQNAGEGILPSSARKDTFKGHELTRQQIAELNKDAGGALKSEYDKLISSPDYRALGDSERNAAIKRLNDTVYGAIRNLYGQKLGYASANDLTSKQLNYLNGEEVSFIAKKEDKKETKKRTLSTKSQRTGTKKALTGRIAKTRSTGSKKTGSKGSNADRLRALQGDSDRISTTSAVSKRVANAKVGKNQRAAFQNKISRQGIKAYKKADKTNVTVRRNLS